MESEAHGDALSPTAPLSHGTSRPPLELPQRMHMIGVGGAGLSGLARVLIARGHTVSGHDRAGSGLIDALLGHDLFDIHIGETRAEYLPEDTQLVVRSAAIQDDDPQVLRARELGIPVVKYAEVLPLLAAPERTLAVAGTHGKTTTAWMLLHALVGLRADAARTGAERPSPGALIGGLSQSLGTNALAGDPGGWFVVEACEYDRSFLHLAPRGAVIGNVEPDHLDYYGSELALHESFARFADRVHPEGLLVVGPEVPEDIEDAARCTVWRLGRELDLALLGEERGRFSFRIRVAGWASPRVDLAVPGHFNAENAALALALAGGLAGSAPFTQKPLLSRAAQALSSFEGASRRFELWGERDGVEVVHDYAHHPTEVRVTLEAARRAFGARPLHVLFQPHQHSRTARFLGDFVESLRGADEVVVADVYGARALAAGERSAGAPELVDGLKRAGVAAHAGGTLDEALRVTLRHLPEEAALLVLGAGDVEQVKDELLQRLALRGSSSSRAGS